MPAGLGQLPSRRFQGNTIGVKFPGELPMTFPLFDPAQPGFRQGQVARAERLPDRAVNFGQDLVEPIQPFGGISLFD
jgi:hypothetical protein